MEVDVVGSGGRCVICQAEITDVAAPISKNSGVLTTHLEVIFLLRKVLDLPVSLISRFLRGCAQVESWVRVCAPCGKMVGECRETHDRIWELNRKWSELKGKVVEVLKGVPTTGEEEEGGEKGEEVLDIPRETREFVMNHLYPDRHDALLGTGEMASDSKAALEVAVEVTELKSNQKRCHLCGKKLTSHGFLKAHLFRAHKIGSKSENRVPKQSTFNQNQTPRRRGRPPKNANTSSSTGKKEVLETTKISAGVDDDDHLKIVKLEEVDYQEPDDDYQHDDFFDTTEDRSPAAEAEPVPIDEPEETTAALATGATPQKEGDPKSAAAGVTCHICGKKLSASQFLKSHLFRFHNIGDLPVSCDLCGKKFLSQSKLTRHLTSCKNRISKGKGKLAESSVAAGQDTGETPKLREAKAEAPKLEAVDNQEDDDHHDDDDNLEMPEEQDTNSTAEAALDENHASDNDISGNESSESEDDGRVRNKCKGRSKTCHLCGKKLSTAVYLKAHLFRFHKIGDLPISCDLCGNKFLSQSKLARHVPGCQKRIKEGKPSKANATSSKSSKEVDMEHDPSSPAGSPQEDNTGSDPEPQPSSASGEATPKGKCICHVCGQKLGAPIALKNHLFRFHNIGDLPCACTLCGMKFINKPKLDRHFRFCQKRQSLKDSPTVPRPPKRKHNRNTKCHQCNIKFKEHRRLRVHQFRVHQIGTMPFNCHLCNKSVSEERFLKSHLFRVHQIGELPFQCPHCGRGFLGQSKLDRHEPGCKIRTQQKNDPTPSTHICEVCGKDFDKRGTLVKHVKEKHENRWAVHCPQCGKGLDCRPKLVEHLWNFHRIGGVGCQHPGCDKRFPNKRRRDDHVNWFHVKGDPSGGTTCAVCGAKFVHRYSLKYHMERTHEGKWPVYCELCGQGAAHKGKLKIHMARKHGVGGVNCDECGKFFAETNRLKYHKIQNHSQGDPQFCCEECGKGFYLREYLIFHLRKVHGKIHEASRKAEDPVFTPAYT